MDNVPVHINSQSSAGRHGKLKKNKVKMAAIFTGAVVALTLLVLGVLFFYRSSTGSNIDADKYQAVFFTNGQVYFGKLQTLNSEYMKLSDIYYLQTKATTSNPQETTSQTASDVTLVKLGNEIHGPEDEMIISKNQMLFFENLKKDSKVSDSISQYKKDQKK